jgi:hypothetical protein
LAASVVDGELARVAGEPAGRRDHGALLRGGGSFSAARSTMRVISPTSMASHSNARTHGLIDPFGPELLGQPEQPVDLPHLGPRQRRVQQRGRVRTPTEVPWRAAWR